MKKLVAIIVCACLIFAGNFALCFASNNEVNFDKNHISFNDNGQFKMLLIADSQDGPNLPSLAQNAMKCAIEKEKPDFIVLLGDNIDGKLATSKSSAKKAIAQIMDVLEPYGIPVAVVLGNHDDEGTDLTKSEQMAFYQEYSCFVGTIGPALEKSCGNYNIPIYESKDSQKICYNLWMLDSGTHYVNENGENEGYGFVYEEAIEWYKAESDKLKENNGGEIVPSIVFQHIAPIQVYDSLVSVPKGTPDAVAGFGKYWILPRNAKEGSVLNRCPYTCNFDIPQSRLEVDTMLAQGDVKAIVFGHDHTNSYNIPYENIDLISARGCTFASFNNDNRGFSTITLNREDTSTYTTSQVLYKDLFEGNSQYNIQYKIISIWSNLLEKILLIYDKISVMFA